MDWSGVDYCDVFISCLDSHSDGTHSPQRIHCWDSDAMLHFSKSDEETISSLISWRWALFSKFIFVRTTPLTVIASAVLCFTADGRNARHLTYLIFENLWDDHRHFMFCSPLKCTKSRQGNSLLHLTSSTVQKYKSIASSKIIVKKTNETRSSYQDPLWSLKD